MPPTGTHREPPPTIRHVVVTGLMGSGKTTVGQRLAKRLGWAWRDSDVDIEAATGRTVRELRDSEGVVAMHGRESAQLLEALKEPGPSVISAAASVVDDPVCRAAMVAPGVVVVWLHAKPALLATRYDSSDAHRPAYGPSVETFLADQAAEREPWLPAVHAHVIDVDHLAPDEEVARAMEVLASIGP